MSWHPDFGFKADGLDLTDRETYRGCGPHDLALPALAYDSQDFQWLEDELLWTRSWVCVGLHTRIPATGDLLPFSVGFHGTHVQREPDGSLRAAFNIAQHGGCRSIPEQCRTGRRTRCSYTSCGYSRDRDVIRASELDESNRLSGQYLGVNPLKLRPIALATLGPLVFLNLDVAPDPLDDGGCFLGSLSATASSAPCVVHTEDELPCNWKLALGAFLDREPVGTAGATGATPSSAVPSWRPAPEAAALLDRAFPVPPDGPAARAGVLFPNVIVASAGGFLATCIVQPTSQTSHLQRWDLTRLSGRTENAEDLEAVLARFRAAMAADITTLGRHRDAPARARADVTGPAPAASLWSPTSQAHAFELGLIDRFTARHRYTTLPIFTNPVFATR